MKQGKTTPVFPTHIKPMLATLTDEPFDDPDWTYEVKWDGYRALAFINGKEVELQSRNSKSFNEKFYPIRDTLANWNTQMILDGEIVVLNDKGFSDFGKLQTWRSEADGELVYYVFDLLWLDGSDLMNLPLHQRQALLEKALPAEDNIRMSKIFKATGRESFEVAQKLGLEGIIAKKADSTYQPDVRSKEWLKIKTEMRQEVVIGGYTKNENTSKLFSALLVGWFDEGILRYSGPVGTGFDTQTQKLLLEKFESLKTDTCPFSTIPEYNKPSRFRPHPPKAKVTWLKPQLVAEVSYRTISPDGVMRQPSFKGLRTDKEPSEVLRERAEHSDVLLKDQADKTTEKIIIPPGSKTRKSLLNPKDETQVRNIGGHDLKFTNLSKIFWPEERLTKRDMLNYYYQVVPFMLPYMTGRPQTLNRFPNGINGKSFYQKDVTGKVPGWLNTFSYYSEADEREKHFLVCTDEASLLFIASLGCIEMNPWSSRTDKPDHPDWCIIDLDPDNNPFEQVIETAQVVKKVFDAIDVPCYCKTSGSTGIHIYVPLAAKYTYEQSKEFGRVIAKIVHKELPVYTSIERKTADRKGKLYIDFLQNRPQATIAGPYSLRPKPGATVSMPLHWDEVKPGLQIKDFNLLNAIARLHTEGDLFKGVLGQGINMKHALKKAEDLFHITANLEPIV